MSKENLKDMLDNIIADKPEEAEIEFHKHLQDKMQAKIAGAEEVEAPADDEATED